MVKRLLLSAFFILSFMGVSYAQNYIDMCFNYLNAGDYQKAIEAGKLAIKYYPYEAFAYSCLGKAYGEIGYIDLAIESLKKAEMYAKDGESLMYIYNLLGLNYSKKGDLDNALLYYSRSLDLAKKLGDRGHEAVMLNNIGEIFHRKGEFNKALKYYQESLSLMTDKKYKATIYSNIATVYNEKGNYKQAIRYYKYSIEISERYGDYHGSGKTMLMLGSTYRKIKDYENSKYYLYEGLKRMQKVGDKYGEAYGYASFGLYCVDIGDKKLAKQFFEKAYQIFKSIGAEDDANDVLSLILEFE